jgi:hypothetical protein
MPKISRAKRSYWPCPVYVAKFSDGTECRMSTWSQEGKPLDFERGRKICCSAIGNRRAMSRARSYHPDRMPAIAPATDIIGGHFEHDGQNVPDPFFTAATAEAKRKSSALAKPSVLDRLLASIGKLTSDELARLQQAIDSAFQPAE